MDTRRTTYSPAYQNSLNACATSLQTSNALLGRSISTLSSSTSDFPRLSRVLNNERCYEIVTASEIRSAQYSIASEIEPQIKELIALAENGLDDLRQKSKALAAKESQRSAKKAEQSNLAELEARLQAVRQQKEALSLKNEELEHELSRKSRLAQRSASK